MFPETIFIAYILKWITVKEEAVKRTHITIVALVAVAGLIVTLLIPGKKGGVRHLFEDTQFHYQTFRTLGHAVYQGALPGEVMSLVPRITDDESWRREWAEMANRCEAMAEKAADPVSAGNALLRASNYYRAAEFFIPPAGNDLKQRISLHRKSMASFQRALRLLKIPHRLHCVPWGKAAMLCYYFPGRTDKPVVYLHGGFDSTSEECYYFGGAALIARGYPVVMFEGPGQSSMIREHGIRFTPDWHKPVGSIIDFMESREPSLAGKKRILYGASMGGLLAGRAAAFEKRLDGVVLFGAPYDMVKAALFQMPAVGRWMYNRGWGGVINTVIVLKSRSDRGLRWGLSNGTWTIGGTTPFDMLKKFSPYTLESVHEKVKCHVLCIYGEKDIYVSDERQRALFEKSFKNAASYTLKIFTEKDGAAEHCQIGSMEQAVQSFMAWMKEKGLDRS